MREGVHLEDLVVDGRAMFKVDLKEIVWEGDVLKVNTNG
jgi:hypothetical protein